MKKPSISHGLIVVTLFGTGAATWATADLAEAGRRAGAFNQTSKALRKTPATTPETRQRALILEAEAALGLGQAKRAAGLFEQAAGQFYESPEAEVGQIRAYFQEGDIQHAIAFGNIVAGEHPDSTEALGLLAWFEDRVGHTEQTLAKLRDARSKATDDIALLAGLAEVLIDRGFLSEAVQALDAWIARNPPSGVIYGLRAKAAIASADWDSALRWRVRSAHAYTAEGQLAQAKAVRDWLAMTDPTGQASREADAHTGQAPVDSARPASRSQWHPAYGEAFSTPKGSALVAGNGLIVDQGRRVITHSRIVAKSNVDVQLRNGLGIVRTARVERRFEQEGWAVLKLAKAYPADWSLKPEWVAAPDGVKFCFVLGFPVADTLAASSPVIVPGVVFRADAGVAGLMQITSTLTRDHSGSPVFDPSGRLIGLALGKDDKVQTVADRQAFLGKGGFAIRADSLRRLLPITKKPPTQKAAMPAAPQSPSVEALYDRLRPTVVLVVAPD